VLRRLVLVSLLAFGAVALMLGLAGAMPGVTIAGILVWGLSFGGAATQLQTASADAAGNGVDLANAMITTVWNAAIAAGGIVGGVLLAHWGAVAFPWAVLALVAVAFCIAVSAHRHAFKPGARGPG
jgi:predicted MFS family arabinose efflux permease